MNSRELKVNVYNSSKFGHTNISFYESGQHVYTIGANIRMNVPQLALPQVVPFERDDGIYRDESADHLAAIVEGIVVSASVPVTDLQYEELLSEARELEGETFNYSLFTEACIDLVERFYDETGHPGVFGDLFPENARTGSLVWQRVPVTDRSLLSTWPEDVPYYTPPPRFMPDPPPYPAPRIFGDLPDPPSFSDVADAQHERRGGGHDSGHGSSRIGTDRPELPEGRALDLSFGVARDIPEETWATDETLTFGEGLALEDAEALPSVGLGAVGPEPTPPGRAEAMPAGHATGAPPQPEPGDSRDRGSDGANGAATPSEVAAKNDALSAQASKAESSSRTTPREEGSAPSPGPEEAPIAPSDVDGSDEQEAVSAHSTREAEPSEAAPEDVSDADRDAAAEVAPDKLASSSNEDVAVSATQEVSQLRSEGAVVASAQVDPDRTEVSPAGPTTRTEDETTAPPAAAEPASGEAAIPATEDSDADRVSEPAAATSFERPSNSPAESTVPDPASQGFAPPDDTIEHDIDFTVDVAETSASVEDSRGAAVSAAEDPKPVELIEPREPATDPEPAPSVSVSAVDLFAMLTDRHAWDDHEYSSDWRDDNDDSSGGSSSWSSGGRSGGTPSDFGGGADEFDFAPSTSTDLSFGDDYDRGSSFDGASHSGTDLSFGDVGSDSSYDVGYDMGSTSYSEYDYY